MPGRRASNSFVDPFKDRVAEARKRNRLSQSQLAAALGTDPQSVSNWERGVNVPRADDVANLCRVLDVKADWLLGVSVTRNGSATLEGSPKSAETRTQKATTAAEAILGRLVGAANVPDLISALRAAEKEAKRLRGE